MGSSGSALREQVTGLIESELRKFSKEDDEIALLNEQLFDPNFLSSLKNLEQYDVPTSACQESPGTNNEEEIKFAFTQQNQARLQEKYQDLKSALSGQIRQYLNKIQDPQSRDHILKLQTICRVHHALLRQEERERRRVESHSQPHEEKQKKKKELPIAARMGLRFGIETLLNLVKVVGGTQPLIYKLVVSTASNLLSELPPLSLVNEEPTIEKGLESVSKFFQEVLNLEVPGVSDSDQLSTLSPLLGLALVRGDLSAALAVVSKIQDIEPSHEFTDTFRMMKSIIESLVCIAPTLNKRIHMNWNANHLGPNIALSNENLTVTRTDSSGWGCQLSEQSLTSGIHYYEFKIERNSSSCLLLGVAGSEFRNYSNKSSGPHCYTLQADGDSYMNDRGAGNVFRYGESDRLGLLINLEEKNLTFFLNGRKQGRPAFGPLPDEVYLISCFGGSNQLVSIINDPDIPEEAQDALNTVYIHHKEEESKIEEKPEEFKEGQDVRVFPTKSDDILNHHKFQIFRGGDEIMQDVNPKHLACYLLAALDRLNASLFEPFALSEKPSSEPIKARLTKKQGLGLDVQPGTFKTLSKILTKSVDILKHERWSEMEFYICAWCCITSLRMLRSHLFTAMFLQLKPEETGLYQPDREKIYRNLQELLEIQISNFGGAEVTKEDKDAMEALKKEASLTLIHGFEIFYPTQVEKLDYLIHSLEDTLAERRLHDIHLNIQHMLLDKLSIPVNLSAAFKVENQENVEKIRKMYDLLIDICDKHATRRVSKQPVSNARPYLRFLWSAQKVLLSKTARENYTGLWQEILIYYTEKLLECTYKLLNLMKGSSDSISLENEYLGYGTFLENLLSSLLMSLNLFKFELGDITSLVKTILKILHLLNSLRHKPIEKRGIKKLCQTFESTHPYTHSARETHLIKVPGAKKYVLKFDPMCRTDRGYYVFEIWLDEDKQNLHSLYESSNFPLEPVVVENNLVFLSFTSNESSEYWGYKIDIEVEADTENVGQSWLENLRVTADYLVIYMSRILISSSYETTEEESDIKKALSNPIFKYGIQDKINRIVSGKAPQDINSKLIDLTSLHEEQKRSHVTSSRSASNFEKLSHRAPSFTQASKSEPNPMKSINSYIHNFTASATNLATYSEDETLEEWISGSDRSKETWNYLKKSDGSILHMSLIGGQEMEKAERALFAVYAAFFDFTNTLKSIINQPKESDEMMNYIVQQCCNIRKWAQQKKQKLMDEMKEVSYSYIADEIVKKCAILLHSDYKTALNELGIRKRLITLLPNLRRAQTSDFEYKNVKDNAHLKKGNQWRTVKEAMEAMSYLKTLVKLNKPSKDYDDQDEDKKEFNRVNKLIMNFMDLDLSSENLLEALNIRRTRAISRSIGINQLLQLYKSSCNSNDKLMQGHIARTFSLSFSQNGTKKHYMQNLEGIDPMLLNCVQKSFFAIYQQLLQHLRLSEVKDLDCTSPSVAHSYLQIFEALSFPFEDIDFNKLLDLNVHDSLGFMLAWAKGLMINEETRFKFNFSRCITNFGVYNENEYIFAPGDETFSLNTCNRLDGEVEDESAPRPEVPLCMQIFKGEEDRMPIVDFVTSGEVQEGYERVADNVNEFGEPIAIYVKRAEPNENLTYLTGLMVSSINPIKFTPTFTPYKELLIKEDINSDAEARKERKEYIRRAVWALFKLLMYTCSGKPTAHSPASDVKISRLQEVFTELIMEEISWQRTKERVDLHSRETAELKLKDVSEGNMWMNEVVHKIKLHKNPVSDWVAKFKEEMERLSITEEGHSPGNILLTAVNNWFIIVDPAMRGTVKQDDLDVVELELLDSSWKNKAGEFDIFCMLRDKLSQLNETDPEIIQSSILLQNIPEDVYSAQEETALDNIPQILDIFLYKIHKNEDRPSFCKYLLWFKEHSDITRPGIIKSEFLPESVPASFMNSDDEFDLYLTLHTINNNPEHYPDYWAELKSILAEYEEIPPSCKSIYTPAGLTSSVNEYTSSLLWTLCMSCSSKSMQKVLARPDYLLELLKHMIFGANESAIVLSFRIVRKVIPKLHSPQTFIQLWNQLPLNLLDKLLAPHIRENPIRTLLALTGFANSIHIQSNKEFVPNLSKLCVWSHEAGELLRAICADKKWFGEVVKELRDAISQLLNAIESQAASFEWDLGLGALSFLALCSSYSNSLNRNIQEWSFVQLKGGSLPQGHIVALEPRTKILTIYSEEDDAIHKESTKNIDFIVPSVRLQFFKILNKTDSDLFMRKIIGMVELLKDKRQTINSGEVSQIHAMKTLRRQLEILAYQVLSDLVSDKLVLDQGTAETIVHNLYKEASDDNISDIYENSLRYKEVRLLLHNKFKESQIDRIKKSEPAEIEITEEKVEEEEFKFMSEEEENRIISAMNEDQQILVVSLKSMGHSFRLIQQAMQNGLHDIQAIVQWINDKKEQEERRQQENQLSGAKCVYKLKKCEADGEIITKDNSGTVNFEETEAGHLIITAPGLIDEKKYITKSFDRGIYRRFTEFVPELTFLVTIGLCRFEDEGTFGLFLGDMEIMIECYEDYANFHMAGEIFATIEKTQNFSFRIFAQYNGNVSITLDREGEIPVQNVFEPSVYDGVTIGNIGVSLVNGPGVELKGCAIYHGHFTGLINYWSEEKHKDEIIKQESGHLQLVKVETREPNMTEMRLGILGAPIDVCNRLAVQYVNFERALDELLINENTNLWPDAVESYMEPPIVDIQLLEGSEDLDEGYSIVPVFENGKPISMQFPNRKLIAYKQHLSSAPPSSLITDVIISDNATDHVNIGDLTKKAENDKSNNVWIQKVSREKLGSRTPVTGLIWIVARDARNVFLPPGYSLVRQGDFSVNAAPAETKGVFLFLAFRKTSSILGYPVKPLIFSKLKVSEHGLVDYFDNSMLENSLEKIKRVEDELQNYSQFSIVELQANLQYIEKQSRTIMIRNFLMQIIRNYPHTLSKLVTSEPNSLSRLMRILGDSKDTLKNAIQRILQSPEANRMAHLLLQETILQLILAATSSATTEKLSELLIESPHPYENNMRHDQTITIPGASGLRIEFDPQCHTESGCDILRFFRQAGHVDQICEYSGRNFPDFEVEGDVVYLYFYTDSSCVEWGYKFRVIPIEGASANKKDPMLSRLNIESALWILENIVLDYEILPNVLSRFLNKELINPLVVFIHRSQNSHQQEQAINILKGVLKRQSIRDTVTEKLLKLMVEETKSLYHYENSAKGTSSLLQKLVALVAELKDKFNLVVDEKWFLEFCDAFSLMKGFCNRDENMYPVLFDQFKLANKISLELVKESQHPYAKKPSTKEIYIKGASYLEIEFDEKSKLDSMDSLYFSYDKSGSMSVEEPYGYSATEVSWAADPRGPDIALSNNNMSVTRTNSSGWGCALWSESYSSGKIKINFKIENDGRSDYLYIGIFKADGQYRLSDVINSDCSHDLWSWKTTGEFHKRGQKVSNPDARYRSNDTIAMSIDMDERTITFIKNGNDMHTFTDIAEEVIPVICFGGSNQHVTIISVEILSGMSSKLSKKKLTVNSDRVFFHFPINLGFMCVKNHRWRKPNVIPDAITFSADFRKVKRSEGLDAPWIAVGAMQLSEGKHFCEIEIRKMNPGDIIQLGIIPENFDRNSRSLVADNTIVYTDDKCYFQSIDQPVKRFGPGDRIGLLADFEKHLFAFYKDGVLIASSTVRMEQVTNYVWAALLDNANQELVINADPSIPEEIDIMGVRKEVPAGVVGREWGYKFKVTPVFVGDNKLKSIECLNEKQLEKWQAFIEKHLKTITKQAEEQLVQYIDELSIAKGKDPLTLDIEEINPTPEQLLHHDLLEKLTINDLREMFLIISLFNRQVKKLLHLISLDFNMGNCQGLDELQKLFLQTRGYIFLHLKNTLFKQVLEKTQVDSKQEISIDRTKAGLYRNQGKVDAQGIVSVFGQLYRLLNKQSHSSLRHHERIFKVNFKGEGSTDAGGPYNEVISTISDELTSRFLPLLVPTQNNLHNIGDNRDAWIINPSAESPLHLDMFVFLGKMMGVAIRTQNNLNISLPPLFWKKLVMENVTISDLKGVDECCVQMIDILRNLEDNGITPESFADNFENISFSTPDSSGRMVALKEGGLDIPLSYNEAKQYADLVVNYRLHESAQQYAAIRRGISAVVPLNLLNMFSWKQVETMVCGAADIDVSMLMARSEYEGLSPNDEHVKMFWEVLKEMTAKERSLFLRFVWGRSRLPAGQEFKKFKIHSLSRPGDPNNYLPVSHTCFFQLDLPRYTRKDIMKAKLLYAITHCQAIDLDRVAQGGWEED